MRGRCCGDLKCISYPDVVNSHDSTRRLAERLRRWYLDPSGGEIRQPAQCLHGLFARKSTRPFSPRDSNEALDGGCPPDRHLLHELGDEGYAEALADEPFEAAESRGRAMSAEHGVALALASID